MSKETQEYDRDAAMANLTDEERAALKDDELSPEEKAALEDIASDGEDDWDEDEDEDEDDGTDDGVKAEAAAKVDVPESAAEPAKAESAAEDDDADESSLRYRAQLPEDIGDQMRALDEREAEFAKKFKSGDMEADEFIAENKAIANERAKLERAVTKSEIANEIEQQNTAHEWQRKVSALIRNAKENEGIDYSKPLLGAALDKALKDLAAKDEHSDKSMSWFLKEAHKQVKSELGIEKRTKSDDPQKTRKLDTSKLPASLANVPGSDGPGDVGDEFADIDKLDGLAYEQALARMTAGQRERYLAAV